MLTRKFFAKTKPGSSKKIKTQFIEESVISIIPLLKLKTVTEAYKISKHKVVHNLIINNGHHNDIINIERSSLIDLQRRSLGNISFIRHHYEILNNVAILDIFDNIPALMIVNVNFENEEDYNNFVLPSWFGEEITNDEKYTNEYLAIHY